ncbi:MAG: thioredoxin-like domain-containing protein [Gammaproteobacteria bacterium]
MKHYIWLVPLIILLTSTIASCAPENDEAEVQYQLPATEFDPSLPWLNVKRPLTLEDLKGKVVILDFWTYGCINCIHVLEDLRRLEHKYGNQLAIVGVHTPKFDNEKNVSTLRNIIIRYRIEHPVVNDVEFGLARYYGMRAWPTQIVIDPQGKVVGEVLGEGNYDVLDKAVAKLIKRHEGHMNPEPLPYSLERDGLADSLLAAPGKIAVSSRHVAISDTLHNRVIVADHQGKIESIYGGKHGGFNDGDATTVLFSSTQGLAFADDGLYVADTGNHAIRYINLSRSEVETVAGGGEVEIPRSGTFDAKTVRLRSPWGLALKDNLLYIAMAGTHQIWRLDLETGQIRNYAGSGREGLRDGALPESRFSQPSGLSLSGKWLYVADAEDSAIRRIDVESERVETLVGTGLFDFGDRDGSFGQALLQPVLGVAAVSASEIVIADTYNHKLKRLDLNKRRVVSLAGTGAPGKEREGSQRVQLNEPGGLAVLGHHILIADTNNNRIMQYDLDSGDVGEWVLAP